MDRLQSMRVFQQVVEEGGFSAAARKLDLAPTAVTRLVSDLETHLGVRLLQRTTRHVCLTQAGELYLARLRSILSEITDAEIQVRAESHVISGVLRMLAASAAASHVLAAAAAGFQRLHPAVNVEIDVDESGEPPVHQYDLALLSGDARVDPDFVCRPLVNTPLVFCASPDYLARSGTPTTPDDLTHHRVLRLRGHGARPGTLELMHPSVPQSRFQLDLHGVIVSNDSDTLLRATLDGAGISVQPLDLITRLVAANRLRRVLDPWIAGHLRWIAAMASRKFLPARTRAFLDYLVARSGGIATTSSAEGIRTLERDVNPGWEPRGEGLLPM